MLPANHLWGFRGNESGSAASGDGEGTKLLQGQLHHPSNSSKAGVSLLHCHLLLFLPPLPMEPSLANLLGNWSLSAVQSGVYVRGC